MGMIGPEEVGELDERLLKLFQTLGHTKDACGDDVEAARRFLEWVMYTDRERDNELDVRAIEWSEGLNEFERPMLTEIARAAASLVRTCKNRDKPPLIERCRRSLSPANWAVRRMNSIHNSQAAAGVRRRGTTTSMISRIAHLH